MINYGIILLLNIVNFTISQIILEFKRDINLNETMANNDYHFSI